MLDYISLGLWKKKKKDCMDYVKVTWRWCRCNEGRTTAELILRVDFILGISVQVLTNFNWYKPRKPSCSQYVFFFGGVFKQATMNAWTPYNTAHVLKFIKSIDYHWRWNKLSKIDTVLRNVNYRKWNTAIFQCIDILVLLHTKILTLLFLKKKRPWDIGHLKMSNLVFVLELFEFLPVTASNDQQG